MLRRGPRLWAGGLGRLRQRRRELGRGRALRLSQGLGRCLRLSMGAARRLSLGLCLWLWLCLRLCLGGGLRWRCRGLRYGLGTGGRLGLRDSLSRGLLPTGHLGLPRILGLRGKSVGDGCWLGGKLRMRREPGLGRSLGLRRDLARCAGGCLSLARGLGLGGGRRGGLCRRWSLRRHGRGWNRRGRLRGRGRRQSRCRSRRSGSLRRLHGGALGLCRGSRLLRSLCRRLRGGGLRLRGGSGLRSAWRCPLIILNDRAGVHRRCRG